MNKGYTAPARTKIPVVGETGYAALLLGAESMRLSGFLSEHDLVIAKELAYVLAGGKLPFGTEVEEQYILNLEKQAFLKLISTRNPRQGCSTCSLKVNHSVIDE
ncbi:hypothetical protein KEH51_12340 [[Brevibacterium] frigoritolerans]|uniref:Uncharacterized protein n=1 Tax=Peribacillus frigoritolerans TaxID=450367 RepID=A0A941J2N0_9BACI|nr:hypothetical protein [Peribacillus frigoritolerans]